jgi:nucleoside-diphosphate kinase
MERTFVIIKPDAVQRGLVGEIVARFERRGLKIVGMKFIQVSEELARKHYAVHEGKPFFNGLIQYIVSAPVVAMVLEGTNAIAAVRKTLGATRPAEAELGTIRADFGLEIGRNLVHGSDGADTAVSEIALWFGEDLVSWGRASDPWIFE